MDMIDTQAIACFAQELAHEGKPFICTDTLPAARAKIRFLGEFMGRRVIWNMQLNAAPHRHNSHKAEQGSSYTIYKDEALAYHIELHLDVTQIDEPCIQKTLIMIRQYKRLALGHHQWGRRPGPS